MTRMFIQHRKKISVVSLFVLGLFVAPISIYLTSGSIALVPNVSFASVGSYVGNMLMQIGSWVTGMGGTLLQLAIEELVFGMGDMINNKGLGIVIDANWQVIRDLCNLAFIFGFIYVGVRTIIDPESADTKQFLARIIIGAILINFSLFFAKFVIDVSNFTSVQIYENIATRNGGTLEGLENPIAASFANAMGVAGIYNNLQPEELEEVTGAGAFTFYLLGTITLMVAGFILAAGAFLLIIRFVALVLIMMFSPLLFAATVFPQTKEFSIRLWGYLINYAFFAPVYLFLLLVSLRVVEKITTQLRGTDQFTDAFQGKVDSFGVLLNFIIVALFMIFPLMIAKKMSIAGADTAINWGNTIRKKSQSLLGGAVGGATAGLAARSMRATVGSSMNRLSESNKLKDATAIGGVRGWAARRLLEGSRGLGDASFDARNIAGVGKKIGIGEGRKGGYATITEEMKKKEEKFVKSLGEVDNDDRFVRQRSDEIQEAKAKLAGNKDFLENEAKRLDAEAEKEEVEVKKLQEQASQISLTGSQSDVIAATAQLNALQSKIANGQTKIATFKRGASDSRQAIRDLDQNVKIAEQRYTQEKQRRVLGSTFAESKDVLIDDVEIKMDALASQMEANLARINSETDEAILAQLGATQDAYHRQMTELRTQKSEIMNSVGIGYAKVLENSTHFTAGIVGRSRTQERDIGNQIREDYMKKIKKTDDDKRNDALIEAIKASAPKNS